MAYKEVLYPLKQKGYNIKLVGSIATQGFSNKDIDILLKLPAYPYSDKIFRQFENDLTSLGWEFYSDNETEEYGVFHCYQKEINNNFIGLDIFIEEEYIQKSKNEK